MVKPPSQTSDGVAVRDGPEYPADQTAEDMRSPSKPYRRRGVRLRSPVRHVRLDGRQMEDEDTINVVLPARELFVWSMSFSNSTGPPSLVAPWERPRLSGIHDARADDDARRRLGSTAAYPRLIPVTHRFSCCLRKVLVSHWEWAVPLQLASAGSRSASASPGCWQMPKRFPAGSRNHANFSWRRRRRISRSPHPPRESRRPLHWRSRP